MAEDERLICRADELLEGGKGIRFTLPLSGRDEPAFVVRYEGKPYAFLNRCGHVPIEMDWQPGEFFDYSKLYLICSVHGALYSPQTGECLGGRCRGHGLVPLDVVEREGSIYLKEKHSNGPRPQSAID